MSVSPDQPADSTPAEGGTLVPDELQPETQGETPEDAQEGPEGQGDLDPTAYAEQEEQEDLAAASMHEESLVDGTSTEQGFAAPGEGGPTEQG